MAEKIDITELERTSSKEKSVRDRIDQIVAAYGRSCNTGCKYPASYGCNSYEVKDGIIEISIEFYCQGTTDIETIHVPVHLVNATDAEMDTWFVKRSGQIELRDGIRRAKKAINENDNVEKELLLVFKHLHDPGWIHAKIVEINGLINKNNEDREIEKAKIDDATRKLDAGFELSGKDDSMSCLVAKIPLPRSSHRFFMEGFWRDICSNATSGTD